LKGGIHVKAEPGIEKRKSSKNPVNVLNPRERVMRAEAKRGGGEESKHVENLGVRI